LTTSERAGSPKGAASKSLVTIAILEACYRKGHLSDLREAYTRLLKRGIYVNLNLINQSLKSLKLPSI